MAAAPRTAQWFTAADGTRHPLIEISSDSSDDELAVGGSRDVLLAPLDPAAAQAGDASEDGEREVAPGAAGARSFNNMLDLCRSSACMVEALNEMAQTRARTDASVEGLRGLSAAQLPRVPRPNK